MKDRSGRREITVWSFPDVQGGDPVLWGTCGTRVVDLLDRINAGDSIEEVAKDFCCDEADLELLVSLADVLLDAAGYSEVVREREKLREEQRAAIASVHFAGLPVATKSDSSVVCAEGEHDHCQLLSCSCDCHREAG
jgi:uncharacterized protein (DUF433 family)